MRPTAHTWIVLICAAWPLLAQERRGQELENLLKRLDKDGDGRISAGEFPRGEERFRRLDRNRDGFLSRDDFPNVPGAKPEETAKPAAKEAAEPANFGEPTPADLDFFEKKIRPVLVKSCYSCHSVDSPKLRGGLRVDSREALLLGGASGPSVVPGDADASLLLKAMRYEHEELRMPPKGKLGDEVIADFERWIKMGAPDPRRDANPAAMPGAEEATATYRTIDIAKGKEFWAYRSPTAPAVPSVKNSNWPLNPIDHFVLAELEERSMAPAKDADKRVWIRRLSFDLRGLPPTPEEIEQFLKDQTPEAFEKIVDQYLASPAYGERWGRHWLDVARYAESSGKETNILFPQAWRYRDYVIDAFNADKPYDRFLTEQLAGDLLPTDDPDEQAQNLIATGFLAIGAKSLNTRDPRQFAMDLADEQIDTTTQAMLGVTVACARCHDHKFDPIPTEDYYALAGVFLSTETCYGTPRVQGSNHPRDLLKLPWTADVPDGPTMAREQRLVLTRLKERGEAQLSGEAPARRRPGQEQTPAGETPKPATPEERRQQQFRERTVRQQVGMLEDLLSRFDENGNPRPENRMAMGVREADRPRNAPLLERGELEKAKAPVARGFPQVLSGPLTPAIKKGSGRRELAAWITAPDNPLTARVMVNRIWLHLFGTGIVATPDNLGMSGQTPSHPELLDWLATTFVADGWSVKQMIKRVVLSRAYRMDSEFHPQYAEQDPEGIYLWRMPKRRLEGEAIRDAMLAVSGTLDAKRPVGSPVGTFEGQLRRQELGADPLSSLGPVRSVYLPILRDRVPEALDVFDFADPSFVTGDREETNVATQALYLMNDPEVMRTADAMAARLVRDGKTDDDRIRLGFALALGRSPSSQELATCREFLRQAGKDQKPVEAPPRRRRGAARRAETPPAADPKLAPWSSFCQALFQTAEFRYVD